jgi:hypothetical protein
MKYISINAIFSSLHREIKTYGISDSDIIEWCGEALEAIQSASVYQPAVRFSEVINHQCEMPNHLHVILQLARNNKWIGSALTPQDVITDTTTNPEVGPDIPVALDVNGQPINDYGVAYYRPFFDVLGEYNILGEDQPNYNHFTPIRLANNVFFNTIVAREPNFENLYTTCRDEYTIVDDVLRFSFETGQVAISYLRQKLDCTTNYPMIPDTYSNKTAILKYIIYKLKEIDFYNNRQGSESRLQKAESDWQWYCKQAVNENMMPQTIDEWENLMRQRNYIMPQDNRYYGFFGKLAHTENRNLIDYGRR